MTPTLSGWHPFPILTNGRRTYLRVRNENICYGDMCIASSSRRFVFPEAAAPASRWSAVTWQRIKGHVDGAVVVVVGLKWNGKCFNFPFFEWWGPEGMLSMDWNVICAMLTGSATSVGCFMLFKRFIIKVVLLIAIKVYNKTRVGGESMASRIFRRPW